MFTAAPFTIAKTWKQPKCPLTDEWIKEMGYIYTMEYYSAIKKEWTITICSNMDGPRDYTLQSAFAPQSFPSRRQGLVFWGFSHPPPCPPPIQKDHLICAPMLAGGKFGSFSLEARSQHSLLDPTPKPPSLHCPLRLALLSFPFHRKGSRILKRLKGFW